MRAVCLRWTLAVGAGDGSFLCVQEEEATINLVAAARPLQMTTLHPGHRDQAQPPVSVSRRPALRSGQQCLSQRSHSWSSLNPILVTLTGGLTQPPLGQAALLASAEGWRRWW